MQAALSSSGAAVEGQSRYSRAFLAVLPLTTLADDPVEDRVAADLVEAIITDLAKLSELSAMAHASLLNLNARSIDLSAIRDEFGATHALRGSLERNDDLIRVNIQLIDIATNSTIWADRLDGNVEDLLDLQDILTERIVSHLAVKVSPEEQTRLNVPDWFNTETTEFWTTQAAPPPGADGCPATRYVCYRPLCGTPHNGRYV